MVREARLVVDASGHGSAWRFKDCQSEKWCFASIDVRVQRHLVQYWYLLMLARIIGSTHWLDGCVISAASIAVWIRIQDPLKPNISLCFFLKNRGIAGLSKIQTWFHMQQELEDRFAEDTLVHGSSSWGFWKQVMQGLAHLAISFYEQPGYHW